MRTAWRTTKQEYVHAFCSFRESEPIDVQQMLPGYTPFRLSEEVKRVIRVLGKDGGYILAPSRNLQFDTSIENMITMYETAQNRKIRR